MANGEDDTDNKQSSIFNKVYGIADSNIRLIRNGLYLVCGVGIVVIGRSIYVTRVFKHAEEIPATFLQNHTRLLGITREITDEGIVKIQHIPPLKIPFKRQSKDGSLQVKLACLDISAEGRLWLRDNIKDKKVWFKLLHRNVSILHCSVEIPKMLRNNNINESLMKQGLCKVSSTEDLAATYSTAISTDTTLLQYLDKMVYLENRAANKGAGMWKVNKPIDSTWGSKGVNVIKTVVTSPFKLVYWIYEKVKRRKGRS